MVTKIHTREFFNESIKLALLSFLLIFGFINLTFGQNGITCNDHVQISLIESCSYTLWPDDILEDQRYPDDAYSIRLFDQNGNQLPDATLRSGQVGGTVTVQISVISTGVTCWGTIAVKDKYVPTFPNCNDGFLPDVFVRCTDDLEDNGLLVANPSVIDNCSNSEDITIEYTDVEDETLCGESFPITRDFNQIFDTDFARNVVTIVGDVTYMGNNTALNISASSQSSSSYCAVIPSPAKISFVWSYQDDEGDASDAFYYSINGSNTYLANNTNTQNGVVQVNVDQGDVFCLEIDANANAGTGASATIQAFQYAPTSVLTTTTRTWTATDICGNVGSCQQNIKILKGDIWDVSVPPHYDGLPGNEDYFTCSDVLSGDPGPDVTGRPSGEGCTNIQVIYSDLILPICGASYKILRQWKILDWCTGEERSVDQVIKILDESPPVCVAMNEFEVYTLPGSCNSTFQLPALINVFDCSETTMEVGYKVKNEGDSRDSPFATFKTENVVGPDSDGIFTIENLEIPQDSVWLAYRLTDACGNICEARNEAMLVDNEQPSAICEGFTVVSLNPDGIAEVFAETFDDHSSDNCGIDRFEVKRLDSTCAGRSDDTIFGPSIQFCCNDVGDESIRVKLRVYDLDGNFSDCLILADVQEKVRPTITDCPDDITVNCDGDFSIEAIGLPSFADNCSATMTHTDTESINNCGKGGISRTFTVTDPMGHIASCSHLITISDFDPFDINDINFPRDTNVDGCVSNDADPLESGEPILSNIECVSITYGYEDQLFYNIDGYCAKILRTWTVIDWCEYDQLHPNPNALWTYVQKITLSNGVEPQFREPCTSVSEPATTKDCEGYIELIRHATDDCTPESELTYAFDVDLFHNSSVGFIPDIARSSTNDASDTYPTGSHRIRFYAIDKCQNIGTCEFSFSIVDQTAPSIVCLGTISLSLPDDGSLEIWASDFIKESIDDCRTSEEGNRFSFSENPLDAFKTFTCADITNGALEEIPLEIYSTDPDGNQSFCRSTMILTDTRDLCEDEAGASSTIMGVVTGENFEAFEDIEVSAHNMTMNEDSYKMTNEIGQYAFDDLSMFYNYQVSPMSSGDPLNGVSTLDLVLMQQHILGLKMLSSPYKIIAADVNQSGNVSAIDLVELRKLILGFTTELKDGVNWRYVDGDYLFNDSSNPFPFPESIGIENLIESQTDANFIAVKLGDVNASAVYNSLQNPEIRSSGNVTFNLDTRISDRTVSYAFKSDNFDDIRGMQFTVDYDPSLMSFANVESGKIELEASNYLVNDQEGYITFSWNDQEPVNIDPNETAFAITFTKRISDSSAPSITLNSEVIKTEAYNRGFEFLNIVLEGQDNNASKSEFALYQNTPNPFSETTKVGFTIPSKGDVSFTIYNIHGQLIHEINGNFGSGYNEIEVDVSTFDHTGVMYYKIEAGEYTASKKMIFLE